MTGLHLPWTGRKGFPLAFVPWATLGVVECLRKWGRAAELRAAAVTGVGVLSTPASPSRQRLAQQGVDHPRLCCTYSLPITGVLHLLFRGLRCVMSCDGGGYGCVSYLAFLARSLWCLAVDAWKQNLLLLSQIALPVILNQSHWLTSITACNRLNWEFIVEGRNWQNWEITQLLHKPLWLDSIL